VFVGADRIAKNGDFANKIGTYGVAVLAHHHKIPFYAVAPRTTFDPSCPSGQDIPIEQRAADEVRAGKSPVDCRVYNPAFDVTPRELITGIVLDDCML
jgi:methylthioribose-1-phosphate isomerase